MKKLLVSMFALGALSRTTGSNETRTAIFDIDQDMHVVKFGLNYRF
jgi:hypothetical protein